ncbi:MAG: TonB family protein, partial [Gammaproteobacteria bacterium]
MMKPMNNLALHQEHAPGEEEPGTHGALSALIASSGVDVFVLSADPALVDVVRGLVGEHPSVSFGGAWQTLAQAVDAGRCDIVLLDMDHVGAALDKRLAELERSVARPVVVASSGYKDAPELMRALTERRIHRLLLKPASPGNTRLLLEAAINRSLQRLAQASAAITARDEDDAPRPAAGSPGRRRGKLLAVAMALVFIAVLVAGLWQTRPEKPAPVVESRRATAPSPRVEPVAAPAPAPDPLAEPLARADRALEAGWLVDPPGDNALDGYAAILAEQPDHARASEGLSATLDLLFTWAESALLGGAFELAETTLDHVRRVRPESSRLAFLDAQLGRARAEAAAAEVQAASEPPRPAPAAQPRELDRFLAIAERRMRSGQLVRPAGDNALAYFRQAAAISAADRAVVAMRARLGAALVASTRERLDAGDTGQAEALLVEARHLGADAALLAELEARLGEVREARRQEREAGLLARALERVRDGQLVAPEEDSAAHYLAVLRSENPAHPGLAAPLQALTATLVENFEAAVAAGDLDESERWLGGLERLGADAAFVGALAGELAAARRQDEFLRTAAPAEALVLLSSRAPVYPMNALGQGIEGWVELEFIVDREGRPRDIVVTDAVPSGTFDRAAANAVERYRYEPFVVDGVRYERRVRLRTRFAL